MAGRRGPFPLPWRSVLIVLAAAAGLLAATAAAEDLEGRLQPLIEGHGGTVAVCVRHLETGDEWGWRDAEPMPTASLIKIAVMVEAYRQAEAGALCLDEQLTLRDEDKVPGAGILSKHFSDGASLSLRDAIRLMIAWSDNTATNLVLDRIGLSATAAAMETLGLPQTKIHAKVFRAETSLFPERSREFGLGSTTAAETVRLLELLHQDRLASPAASAEMLEHLRACEDRDTLPRLLPPEAKLAHKTGAVSGVRTAAGILETPTGPVALCVLTSDNEDRRWARDNAGNVLCGRIARAVYEHFSPANESRPSPPGTLGLGDAGWLVEALQRTLNQRLEPSPGLSVDGEFGPETRKAVVALQEAHGLPGTGAVDRATWKALGPLAAGDEPVTDPEAPDLAPPPKASADPLEGPPFVTCRAWVVGDLETGTLVGSENASQRLDIASTTKLMTALVVLRLADAAPDVLDEVVTISRRAAGTPGSSAGVREGERIAARELLYGLLLPSGNDAATALAEHVGGRFDPEEGADDPDDPLGRFVAEMNRTAAALGMHDTRYANPHGLTARGHRSTARDLFTLACAACRDERLLEYVGARQSVGRLEGPVGYSRYVLWKNTNRLLATEGYDGVKTGTTRAAGACLISLGRRGSEGLVVVVLGATSPDARYTDTRNLFRWAWRERGHAP